MNALLKVPLVLALVIAAASNAPAHEWYPLPCCSDKDCHALLEERGETVAETIAGWRLWDGRTIPHELTRFSPDGRFHLCETPSKGVICLFAPQETS
jgi:hypothetical protein